MRNEVLGVIEFFSTGSREPDDDLLKMMHAIGREIGQFVERMRAEAACVKAKSIYAIKRTSSSNSCSRRGGWLRSAS